VFKKPYDLLNTKKHLSYYVNKSMGLACGFLLTAIHNAGLAAVTHTPSPMDFLKHVLNHPSNKRLFLLIPVGNPDENAEVPNLERKILEEVCKFY
jgi:hypothetical protein